MLNRIFKSDSPARSLNVLFLARYLNGGNVTRGTLLYSVVKEGFSPIDIIFEKHGFNKSNHMSDGVVDSLRGLIFSPSFGCPNSKERRMANLLTKAF